MVSNRYPAERRRSAKRKWCGADAWRAPSDTPSGARQAAGSLSCWRHRRGPAGREARTFTADHVVSQLQLLLFSGLAFFLLLDVLQRTPSITLDTDRLYRWLGLRRRRPSRRQYGQPGALPRPSRAVPWWRFSRIEQAARQGALSRAQDSGTMAMLATVMLAVDLLVEFVR